MAKEKVKKDVELDVKAEVDQVDSLEERIDELDKRIDDLIVDFGDVINDMQKTLDKICVRMGLPKN